MVLHLIPRSITAHCILLGRGPFYLSGPVFVVPLGIDPMKNVRMHSRASIKAVTLPHCIWGQPDTERTAREDEEGKVAANFLLPGMLDIVPHIVSPFAALHSLKLCNSHYPSADKVLPSSIQSQLHRSFLGSGLHSLPWPVRSLLCLTFVHT